MIDKTFIISSLFILTLSVFYTISFQLQVPVWNDTVANLTLMALGEKVTPHLIDLLSDPLDLLRCPDHLGHVGYLGHLGDPHFFLIFSIFYQLLFVIRPGLCGIMALR